MGIHPVDMAVTGVYLLLLVVTGIGAARSVKTTSDFLLEDGGSENSCLSCCRSAPGESRIGLGEFHRRQGDILPL